MSRCFTILATVAALLAIPAAVGAKPGLFPPDVISAGGEASFAEKLNEPPLWPPGSRDRTAQRIRMFIGGHTVASWSVRLDQSQDGRWTGYFRENNGHRLTRDERFKVTDADVSELQALIAESGMWKSYPQFWASQDNPNEICIDGMTVVFERVDATGYRYSEGNAQCAMGGAQLAVAAKLMRMAGRTDLERLLH